MIGAVNRRAGVIPLLLLSGVVVCVAAGFARGVWVANLPSGKPELHFTSELKELMKKKNVSNAHVSLSDERGIAFATVILECEK